MSTRQNKSVSHVAHADDTFWASLFKVIFFILFGVRVNFIVNIFDSTEINSCNNTGNYQFY